jgi:hypothetical protein
MQMKFFQKNILYKLSDHKRNTDILEELKVEPVDEKLRKYKSNWIRHLTRTNSNMMPKKNNVEL